MELATVLVTSVRRFFGVAIVALVTVLGMVATPPAAEIEADVRLVATATCTGFSANCTFTITPAEQRSIIGGSAAGAIRALGAVCGAAALGCLVAAAAIGGTIAGVIGSVKSCDFLFRTQPIRVTTGIVVTESRHLC